MKARVFIDGREGTTGLRIDERLRDRADIELLEIDPALRKDADARKKLLNTADIVFLCLPDTAAREAVALIDNPAVRVLDASTAHRTSPDWVYGFPELSGARREAVTCTKRLAVPGCHASGFVAGIAPLRALGLLAPDALLTCHSVTGYSGGGKKMIADYEEPFKTGYDSPRQYALGLTHKHLPEMRAVCALDTPPVFNPIVGPFYAGMVVTVPLHLAQLTAKMTAYDVWECLDAHYEGSRMVRVQPFGAQELPGGMLDASGAAGRDTMEIYVTGHDTQVLLAARFDNLGKGASGAAVQCMNIMLGQDETTGLAV